MPCIDTQLPKHNRNSLKFGCGMDSEIHSDVNAMELPCEGWMCRWVVYFCLSFGVKSYFYIRLVNILLLFQSTVM